MVARRIGGEDIRMTPLEVVNYAAAAFAGGAAVLWFLSAKVEMPEEFLIALEISVSAFGGSAGGRGYSIELSELALPLKRQSRISGYAAISAGIAVILGGIAFAIS